MHIDDEHLRRRPSISWLYAVYALALALLVFCGLNGLIVANSLAGALVAWPGCAGAASALVGAIQAGSGIVGSAVVGRLADGTPWPLGLTMGLAGIGSFACTRLLPGSPER